MSGRPDYASSDFDAALARSRTATLDIWEASLIFELRRLLKDGNDALADKVAADFIKHSPENRQEGRAIALLKLAAEFTSVRPTTDIDRGSPGRPRPGETLQQWHERAHRGSYKQYPGSL